MDSAVIVPLITIGIPAFLAAVATPIIVAWVQLKARRLDAQIEAENRRIEKEQDWKRQDDVAARAAEASRLMLSSQAATTVAQEETTRANAVTRQETSSQLSAIHTLVNSNLSTAFQAELNSTRRELIALREIMAIKTASGSPPDADALAIIEVAERRVIELEEILEERRRKDALATAQVEDGQTASKIAAAVAVAAKPAAEAAARKVVPPVVTETVPPVVKAAVKEALAEHDKTKK